MKLVPNIVVIGEPLVSLGALGIEESETVVRFSFKEATNDQGNIFLPHLLIKIGVFESSNECRRINTQRQKSSKFNTDPNQNLWRNLEQPEFTEFKIGRKGFCLVVGE